MDTGQHTAAHSILQPLPAAVVPVTPPSTTATRCRVTHPPPCHATVQDTRVPTPFRASVLGLSPHGGNSQLSNPCLYSLHCHRPTTAHSHPACWRQHRLRVKGTRTSTSPPTIKSHSCGCNQCCHTHCTDITKTQHTRLCITHTCITVKLSLTDLYPGAACNPQHRLQSKTGMPHRPCLPFQPPADQLKASKLRT